jgi:hypothetical protein
MTYEQFTKSFFKARKKGDSREPMSEKDFREMMGLDRDHHAPIMVRPKKDARLIAPSLKVHEKKQTEEIEPQLKNDELPKKIDELIVKKERKPRQNSLAHKELIIAYSIKIDDELSMIDFLSYSIKQRIKRLLEIAYEDGLKQQGIENEQNGQRNDSRFIS